MGSLKHVVHEKTWKKETAVLSKMETRKNKTEAFADDDYLTYADQIF